MARSSIHNFVRQKYTILDYLKNIFTSWAKRNRRKEGRKRKQIFRIRNLGKVHVFFEKFILTRESVSMP